MSALGCAALCCEMRRTAKFLGSGASFQGSQRHQNQHQKLEHHGQPSQFDRADLVLGLESWAAGAGSQGDGDAKEPWETKRMYPASTSAGVSFSVSGPL